MSGLADRLLAALTKGPGRSGVPSDGELVAAAQAASPLIEHAIVRVRPSPFGTDVDLRLYAPCLPPEDPGATAGVLDAAAGSVRAALGRPVKTLNVDVVIGRTEAGDAIGDHRAVDLRAVAPAFGDGVHVSRALLTYPKEELERRFGPEGGVVR